MKLVVAALLGLVQVQAIRFSEYSEETQDVKLSDDEQQSVAPDDSDVVIQIYDSNLENGNAPAPMDNDSEEFVQTNADVKFRPNPAQSPWAASPAAGATNDITGAFTKFMDGSDEYTRVLPGAFDSSDRDDLLMRSAMSTYAVEGKGADGKPNGKFFITRSDMNGLADEVLANNMGFGDAAKRQAYADARLPGLWQHFDLFGKGYIKAEEVPQFLRLLLGEVEVSNSLQVQLDSTVGSDTELVRPIDNVVLQFRPNPSQAPWASKPDDSKPSAIDGAYTVYDDGKWDYERKVPSTWDSTDKDDLLMKSVIKNYALEGKCPTDGSPTGKFYLDLDALYKVGEEVVRTHIGYTGAKNKAYLDEHIPKIFKHLDINNQGYIIAEKAPQALRLLLGEVEIQNGLQVQLGEDMQQSWRPDPVLSPFAAKPADPPPPTKITGGYAADFEKHHLNYEREVPDKYKDDLLMNSLVSKYAIEGKTNGEKNGHYFMTKDATAAVADEVVQTHIGLKGDDKAKYIAERLDKLWAHYDVNNEGYVEVERIPVLLRQMVGEVEANFGLQ